MCDRDRKRVLQEKKIIEISERVNIDGCWISLAWVCVNVNVGIVVLPVTAGSLFHLYAYECRCRLHETGVATRPRSEALIFSDADPRC